MKRTIKYSLSVTFMIIIFLGILVFIEAISYRHHLKFDLTKNKTSTLSSQSVKILESLKNKVEAIAFFKKDEPGSNVLKNYFELYSYHSPKFEYKIIDPDRNPEIARKYQIKEYGTILIMSRNNKEILYKWDEEKITNAIIRVTREKKKRLYFLTGHGENDINDSSEEKGLSHAKNALEDAGYEIRDILLVREGDIPKDASVFIINGPKKDLLEAEVEKIEKYIIDSGGKVLFLVDPGSVPNISRLLNKYGIILGDNIIVDKMSQLFGADFTTPVVDKYEDHPITKNFNVYCFFPLCRSIDLNVDAKEGVNSQVLVKTGEGSWAETDIKLLEKGRAVFEEDKDKKGPIGVMAISDVPVKNSSNQGKVIVFGDSDFISNIYIDLSGNRDLFLNAVSYLAEEKDLISIRPKKIEDIPLSLTSKQGKTLFIISVVIIPASVLILGIFVFIRRRYIG